MKAIQVTKSGGPEVLKVLDLAEPTPGDGQVVVKVEAAGVNYATTDFVEAAKRETGGRGVDVVLESVGGDVFEKSLHALAPAGRLVVFGAASGKPGTVQVPALQRNNLTVATFSIKGTAAQDPAALRAGALELLALLEQGKLRPVIGRTYPLAEAAQAQQHIEGRGSYGKVLLLP